VNRGNLAILGIAVFSLMILFSVPDAHAASMTFNVDTIISSDQTIANGEVWIVQPGVTLTINPGVTVTVDSGGTINNQGTINNSGTINNYADIINNPGFINNSGTINNFNYINNYGNIDNSGTINNISNPADNGVIDNSGIINNSDTINNYGIINNTGTINNTGAINNIGTINNSCAGVITGIPIFYTSVVQAAPCIDADGDGVFADTDADNNDPCVPSLVHPLCLAITDNDGDGVFADTDADDNDPCVPNPGAAACLAITGSIGDTVYRDDNDNGVQDGVEPGIPGVTVGLSCTLPDGTDSQVTDANGNYLFTGIPAGSDCEVTVDDTTAPDDMEAGECPASFSSIAVTAGESFLDADFCFKNANTPPIAESNGTYLMANTDSIFLDSTGSGDSDPGDVISYLWSTTSNCTFDDATLENPQITCPDAGIFDVTLKVTDLADAMNSDTTSIVVYDPKGGFVTGGGWIYSPAGAYLDDDTLSGEATFGFVSKYKKGQSEPVGQTEFQFKVADLNFHSDTYDWLVVAGHQAKYKGMGTINGNGNYGFMLSAVDEKLTPSTDVDLFRMKIWDKSNGDAVVYDNQFGSGDDAEATTEIGGGSIVIHSGKGKP